MLRKSLVVNLVVSVVSTILCMAFVPSPSGLVTLLRGAVSNYATNNALLHPFVFRNILK